MTEPESTTLPKDAPWWARWLAAEWTNAWKWLSVQIGILIVAAPIAYESIPALRAIVPAQWVHYFEAGLGVLAIWNQLRRKSEGAS